MTTLLIQGDARRIPLPNGSVHSVVTSPPYWGLRDYGSPGQIGVERDSSSYVAAMIEVFREVRRVLRADGSIWLNLGDCYNTYNGGAGPGSMISGRQSAERPRFASGFGLRDKALKPKDLIGIPWRVAIALQDDGWYLRAEVIWSKPNFMPDARRDRPARSHEHLFLLARSGRYYWDATKAKRLVPGKGPNLASVWTFNPVCSKLRHSAQMPPKLVAPCILASTPKGGIVLDPFGGAMTTPLVAASLGRIGIAVELNPEYISIGARRIERPHAVLPTARAAKPLPLFEGQP